MRALVSVLIVAALGTTTATWGQEEAPTEPKQTVGNAQEFLSKMLPELKYSPPNWFATESDHRDRWATIKSATPSQRCVNRLTVHSDAYTSPDSNKAYPAVDWSSDEEGVNWGGLTEVTRDKGIVYFAFRGVPGIARINTSESLATRIAYALEFLRQECDGTKNLGF